MLDFTRGQECFSFYFLYASIYVLYLQNELESKCFTNYFTMNSQRNDHITRLKIFVCSVLLCSTKFWPHFLPRKVILLIRSRSRGNTETENLAFLLWVSGAAAKRQSSFWKYTPPLFLVHIVQKYLCTL